MAHTKYSIHSWPAIAGGAAAALGACGLLVQDAISHGVTIEHILAPLCVFLVILAGHTVWHAWMDERYLSAAGLVIVAAIGSVLIVYQSMGRQAQSRDEKTIVAEDRMGSREDLIRELKRSRDMLADAQAAVAAECASGIGPKCRGKRASVGVYQNAILGLEAKLEGQPPVPVDPRADRVAGLAELFRLPASATDVKSAVSLFEPFAFPLFLELASLVLFGYGIGHRRVEENVATDAPEPSALEGPEPVRLIEHDPIIMALTALGGRTDSSDALVDWLIENRGQGSKADVSRKLKELHTAGIVRHYRDPNDARRKITELVDMAQ